VREALNGRATAVTADALMAMNSKTEGRELSKNNDCVYVYHNAIDQVGDKRDTEQRTPQAVETAFQEILKLLRKAAAMNFSQFIITADHGFLYQNETLSETDFVELPQPDRSLKYDRRFVVAPGIPANPGWKCFHASALGINGEVSCAFTKGLQRQRLQGSGSRYVHGGTSLQEIVIPALIVKKERISDVSRVSVAMLRSSQTVTTGQVSVAFYQAEPIGEKMLGRELRGGFYSQGGVLLSDTKLMLFESTETDARKRERAEQFIFTKEAENYNHQEIVLRLEESVVGTSHWAPYQDYSFRLRRAFESDFDEF
jgi:hypothetical protein